MGDYQFNRPTLDDRSDLVALKELVGGGGRIVRERDDVPIAVSAMIPADATPGKPDAEAAGRHHRVDEGENRCFRFWSKRHLVRHEFTLLFRTRE
jgi:hypothetical protein